MAGTFDAGSVIAHIKADTTGFKKGMSLGLLFMAVGTLLFIPSAQMANYPMFLFGLFVIGTGLALLQTASNPYVTILGPSESAAKIIAAPVYADRSSAGNTTLFGYTSPVKYDPSTVRC